MRRDEDVDRAFRELFGDLLLLRAVPEAGEQLDRDRKRREPPRECSEVLVRENRRRGEHGDLLAVQNGLERGAHRDLRLSVADVAAEEPVHGNGPLHVALHVRDRLGLVGGFDIFERVFELLLPRGVLREREALRLRSPRVHAQEVLRQVANGLANGRLLSRPGSASETVELRLRALRAGIFLDPVELLHGEQQSLLLAVGNLDEFAFFRADGKPFQSEEFPDAIIEVHDEIPGLQVAQVRQERVGCPLPGRRGRSVRAEDLLLRDEGKTAAPKAEAGRNLAGEDFEGVEPVFPREALKLFGSAPGMDGDADPGARVERDSDLRDGVGQPPFERGELFSRELHRDSRREAEAVEQKTGAGGDRRFDVRSRVEDLLGRDRGDVRVVVLADPCLPLFERGRDGRRLQHRDHGIRRVIENRRSAPRDRRREEGPLRRARGMAEAPLEPDVGVPRLGDRREGRDDDSFEPRLGALRVGIERAEGCDLVAVELDSEGPRGVGREDVHEAAPRREIPHLEDEIGPRVSLADEKREELFPRERGPRRDRELPGGK